MNYVLDLLHDKQPAIRLVCSKCVLHCECNSWHRTLDIIMEYDHDWAVKIRSRRFQAHNGEWLRAVLHEGVTDVDVLDHESFVHGADPVKMVCS